jgi:hypothetical protein
MALRATRYALRTTRYALRATPLRWHVGSVVAPRGYTCRTTVARASDMYTLIILMFQVSGFRFRILGFGFRVSGFWFRVSALGFQVSGHNLKFLRP